MEDIIEKVIEYSMGAVVIGFVLTAAFKILILMVMG